MTNPETSRAEDLKNSGSRGFGTFLGKESDDEHEPYHDQRVSLHPKNYNSSKIDCTNLIRFQTGQDDGQLFSFIVRDDQQQIMAGLSGWIWAKACKIQLLWVHSSLRGQGHGRELLEIAEQEHALTDAKSWKWPLLRDGN
jgi:ribosomal protein S18 acetylase RimI-like enzyme